METTAPGPPGRKAHVVPGRAYRPASALPPASSPSLKCALLCSFLRCKASINQPWTLESGRPWKESSLSGIYKEAAKDNPLFSSRSYTWKWIRLTSHSSHMRKHGFYQKDQKNKWQWQRKSQLFISQRKKKQWKKQTAISFAGLGISKAFPSKERLLRALNTKHPAEY